MALSKITNASVADTAVHGRRNLVIGGAMNVAQHGTSSTGLTATSFPACDRYKFAINSIGTWTGSQSTDAPDGFSNSFKIECTTADASPAADDYASVQHHIEAQNLQHLNFGSASAKNLILSFWVKSNKVGTYSGYFYRQDSARIFAHEYTINTANTWEYKTVKIAGDTTGTINNDSGRGLRVQFNLGNGSNRATGSVSSSWADYTDKSQEGSANEVNLADAVGNTWQLTGVQLEVGDTATPFEHRSYGEELALCQRYYQVYDYHDSQLAMDGYYGGSNYLEHTFLRPVVMRADPTSSITVGTTSGLQTAPHLSNNDNAHMVNISARKSSSAGRAYYFLELITADAEL